MIRHTCSAGIATLLLAVPAVAAGSGGHVTTARKTRCHGSAKLLGFANVVDVNFSCNKRFKKFKVSANEALDGAGFANEGYTCKTAGAKAYTCSGKKTLKSEETSFSTKATDACSPKALKVKVTAAKKTFTLKGPC